MSWQHSSTHQHTHSRVTTKTMLACVLTACVACMWLSTCVALCAWQSASNLNYVAHVMLKSSYTWRIRNSVIFFCLSVAVFFLAALRFKALLILSYMYVCVKSLSSKINVCNNELLNWLLYNFYCCTMTSKHQRFIVWLCVQLMVLLHWWRSRISELSEMLCEL